MTSPVKVVPLRANRRTRKYATTAFVTATSLLLAGCATIQGSRGLPKEQTGDPQLKTLEHDLRRDVRKQDELGPRHVWPDETRSGHNPLQALTDTANWIKGEFAAAGFTNILIQPVPVPLLPKIRNEIVAENIEVEITRRKDTNVVERIIVIGAHYDTFPLGKYNLENWQPGELSNPWRQTRGANDNGSGVAAMLALARHFKELQKQGREFDCTIRFVAFVNEEPPFFRTRYMGSRVYAERCKNENIILMLTPETLGFYAGKPKRKAETFFEAPFVKWKLKCPSDAQFVAFLTNEGSKEGVEDAADLFREVQPHVPVRVASLSRLPRTGFPSFSLCYPTFQLRFEREALARVNEEPDLPIPSARWSDDASFWQYGFKAFTITDTAHLRYEHYHEASDVHTNLNYPVMAKVVKGVMGMVEQIADNPPESLLDNRFK